jgi:hypothetical protein
VVEHVLKFVQDPKFDPKHGKIKGFRGKEWILGEKRESS